MREMKRCGLLCGHSLSNIWLQCIIFSLPALNCALAALAAHPTCTVLLAPAGWTARCGSLRRRRACTACCTSGT